jgi:hypothetical protein
MRKQHCECVGCRRLAVGIWTNWGQGMRVRTCDRHQYPVRNGPNKCWQWVRNPMVKYGVWEKFHD